MIGKVHEKTLPALRLLEKEGFSCRGYVDIFDAGPTVECDVRNIESVRHSQRCTVTIGEPGNGRDCIISNSSFESFRAVVGKVALDEENAVALIDAEMAEALQVKNGDQVRLIAQ